MAAIKGSTPIRKILKWTAGIVGIVILGFVVVYCGIKYSREDDVVGNKKIDQTNSGDYTGKTDDATEGIYDAEPSTNENGKDMMEPEPNFGELKDPHDVLEDEIEDEEDVVSAQRKFVRPYQNKSYYNAGKSNTKAKQSNYNSFCR